MIKLSQKNSKTKIKMPHILQPKQNILKQNEVEQILKKYNITLTQLPKIKFADASLPEGAVVGDIIEVTRKEEEGTHTYYRVVVM